MDTAVSKPLLQILWHLFSDTATRFNLLVDECAHVQQTIQGHLSHVDPQVFGLQDADPGAAPAADRPWFPDADSIRGDEYHARTPQERALRNLYLTMGALAQALETNEQTFRREFHRVVEHADRPPQTTDAIYWFISLRGHFLNTVFPYYLKHLQHAQEKLIQLLENMPGTLPGPTLMRRWSSGGYGEFLSAYSRQVNSQVQSLLWQYCKPSERRSFDDWRSHQFLVHSWSHNPTSITTRNQVSVHNGEGADKVTLTTIWSSYFYLEQPILFPLLYHECAHHFDDEVAAALEPCGDRKILRQRDLWFNRVKETAELLKQVAPFEEGNLSFWNNFAGELWSDVISISQCGDGFLAALALQIIGLQSEDKTYSDFDTDKDQRIPLEAIGRRDRRILATPYPTLDLGYFWTARAQFALDTYARLFPAGASAGCGNPWYHALKDLLAGWHASGAAAMSEWVASKEHETYWAYRTRLNEWVRSVAWDCMEEFIDSLQPYTTALQAHNEFGLDAQLLELIDRDANAYCRSVTGRDPDPPVATALRPKCRLEDLCPHIRWASSGPIVDELLARRSGSTDADSAPADRWTRIYVEHMVCDGSIGFRLAIEWFAITRDVIAAAVAVKDDADPGKGLPQWEQDHLHALREAIRADYHARWWADGTDAAQRELHDLPKAIHRVTVDRWPRLAGCLAAFKQRTTDRLRVFADSGEDNVGSFALGVIRPAHFHRRGGYAKGLRTAERHFENVRTRRQGLLREGGFVARASRPAFMPLFGEYNFALFQPGLASINKGFHLNDHPASVVKARAALKVAARRPELQPPAFVRVAQIAFRYHWQWVLLAEQLGDGADIYLSSAWEDVIVVTYHASYDDHVRALREQGLRQRRWLDIHSSIGLPAVPGAPVLQQSMPAPVPAMEFAERWSGFGLGEVLERTGRYDITVEWHPQTPQQLWLALDSIPAAEWECIESIVTSLERRRQTDGSERFEFRSHIVLKHDKL